MASLKEIQDAIKIINGFHNKVIILHCVSGYPTKLKDTNIGRINLLKKKFKKNLIGISDHTNSLISTIASIPLGIVAIEKHYKLDDKISTADSEFSIVPRDLKQIRKIERRSNDDGTQSDCTSQKKERAFETNCGGERTCQYYGKKIV